MKTELLAPAKDIDIAKIAIDCGADAVYIGGPSFGARSKAGNSIEDLKKIIEYAHKFYVKVYDFVNFIPDLSTCTKSILNLSAWSSDLLGLKV